jgi:transcription initiation factor TFIID TATA-box-binding protein
MTRIRIENVVASTSLAEHLDLQRIAMRLDGAEYEPSEFPGLIYRMKDPKTAVLLFQSGKLVCTGGKSWKQVNESIKTISGLIQKAGQKVVANPKIEIQNIVATSNLETEINLNSIAVTLGLDRVEYEPEQFPGLVCRLDSPRVVVLLFGSGRLVCTGARRPKDVELAVQHITKELQGAGLLGGRRTSTPTKGDSSARRHRTTAKASGPEAPEPEPAPERAPTSETLAA